MEEQLRHIIRGLLSDASFIDNWDDCWLQLLVLPCPHDCAKAVATAEKTKAVFGQYVHITPETSILRIPEWTVFPPACHFAVSACGNPWGTSA